jgi:hypothetical protein
MKKLATAVAIAALLGVSASASAFWGGGPWGNNGYGNDGWGNNNMMNDMFGNGDGYGDFSMNMGGGGRGYGRGNNRYYDSYSNGYGPYGYGAPYGYAPYGAPYVCAPTVPRPRLRSRPPLRLLRPSKDRLSQDISAHTDVCSTLGPFWRRGRVVSILAVASTFLRRHLSVAVSHLT